MFCYKHVKKVPPSGSELNKALLNLSQIVSKCSEVSQLAFDNTELKSLHLVSGIRLLCKLLGIRQVVRWVLSLGYSECSLGYSLYPPTILSDPQFLSVSLLGLKTGSLISHLISVGVWV